MHTDVKCKACHISVSQCVRDRRKPHTLHRLQPHTLHRSRQKIAYIPKHSAGKLRKQHTLRRPVRRVPKSRKFWCAGGAAQRGGAGRGVERPGRAAGGLRHCQRAAAGGAQAPFLRAW